MLVDERMAAARLVDHVLVERRRVVRAQQREALVLGEGDVQQRLVQLALDQLGAAAAGPDRLADAAHRPRGRATKSRQAGMIRAGLWPSTAMSTNSHVARRRARAQRRDLLRADRDEDRLVALEALTDERERAGEQVVGTFVEERFVAEQSRRRPA